MATITGTTGDDRDDQSLEGTPGADLYSGLAGDDWLISSDGDDTMDGGPGSDRVFYNFGEGDPAGIVVDFGAGTVIDGYGGTDTLVGIEWVVGSDFADTLDGGDVAPADDPYWLFGQGGDDVLTSLDPDRFSDLDGGDGDDILTNGDGGSFLKPGAGDDTVSGGGGFDTIDYFFPSETLDAEEASGIQVAFSGATDGTATDFAGDTDVFSGIERVRGTKFDDTLTGADGEQDLDGLGGDDRVEGGNGNDRLTGGAGDDSIEGGAGDDTLDGGAGDDWAYYEPGNDVYDGGDGFDRMDYSAAPGAVDVDLAGGAAADGGGGIDTLANVDRVIGSAFDDALRGDDAFNSFTGGGGDDLIDGRGGFDFVWYGRAGAAVSVDLETGEVSGGAGADTLISIEGLNGSNFDDTLLGSAADDYFEPDETGNAGAPNAEFGGADVIDGRGGVDTLSFLGEAGAVAIDMAAGTATDGRGNRDTFTDIEAVIGSRFGDDLAGDEADNRLEGSDGDDTLSDLGGSDTLLGGNGDDTLLSGTGVDTFDGGAGFDTYRVDLAGFDIPEGGFTLLIDAEAGTLGADIQDPAEFDTIAGIEAFEIDAPDSVQVAFSGSGGDESVSSGDGSDTLSGGDGADTLQGGRGDDSLSGGGGDDILDDGSGVDTLDGGAGNDTYRRDLAETFPDEIDFVPVADLAEGAFYALAEGPGEGSDIFIDIENIELSGAYDVQLIGDNGANRLSSGAGDDTLAGGEGADTLDGGAGANTLGGGAGDDRYLHDGRDGGDNAIADPGGLDRLVVIDTPARDSGEFINAGSELVWRPFDGASEARIAGDGAGGFDLEILTWQRPEDNPEGRAPYTLDLQIVTEVAQIGTADFAFAGTAGDDELAVAKDFGTSGFSEIYLNAGDDTLRLSGAEVSNLYPNGGDGDDLLVYDGEAAVSFSGDAGDDTLEGGAGDDTLQGGRGDDSLLGGAGDDVLTDGNGNDTVDGGAGVDTLTRDFGEDFDPFSFTVVADIEQGRMFPPEFPDNPGDTLISIERLDLRGSFDMLLIGDEGDNSLRSDGGGDRLEGGGGSDDLVAGSGDDTVIGGAGDDELDGEAGDDVIEGRGGIDLAYYSGERDAYTLAIGTGGVSIEDRRADGDGTDAISGVEILQFADRTWQLEKFSDVAGLSEADFRAFVELYIAYFNRAPDAEGLFFWGSAFAGGFSLEASAREFLKQPEYDAAYPPGLSNLDFAREVYANVLGRDPDPVGLDFWVDVLDSGARTRDVFILEVLKGAKAPVQEGDPPDFVAQKQADEKYLSDKTDIGIYFAVTKGMSDVGDADTAMGLFDGSPESVDAAVAAIDGFHDAALDPETGEFLLTLVGVVDDPFAG